MCNPAYLTIEQDDSEIGFSCSYENWQWLSSRSNWISIHTWQLCFRRAQTIAHRVVDARHNFAMGHVITKRWPQLTNWKYHFCVGSAVTLAESGEAAPNFPVRRVPARPNLANRLHSTSTPVFQKFRSAQEVLFLQL